MGVKRRKQDADSTAAAAAVVVGGEQTSVCSSKRKRRRTKRDRFEGAEAHGVRLAEADETVKTLFLAACETVLAGISSDMVN